MRKVVEAVVCPEMDQSVIVDVESANLGECCTVDLTTQDQWFLVGHERAAEDGEEQWADNSVIAHMKISLSGPSWTP